MLKLRFDSHGVPPVSADVRDTRLASQLSFDDVALTDQRMARYPVFRDATRGHEKFAIRVRDNHHLNRHVNDCGCPCRQT
jgi:hypothetical protein